MNSSVPARTLRAHCGHPRLAHTGLPRVHGPDPLEHSNNSARVIEHFYFIYFHPSFSQWAAVSLSEVCSESQRWLSVGGGFAGEHRHTAQCRAPVSLPHTMPDASGSGEALACRGPSSCSLSATQPCFFSAPGEDECVSMVHPRPQVTCSCR